MQQMRRYSEELLIGICHRHSSIAGNVTAARLPASRLRSGCREAIRFNPDDDPGDGPDDGFVLVCPAPPGFKTRSRRENKYYPPVRRLIMAAARGLAPDRTATLTSEGRPELMARSTAGATSAGFSTYSA